MSGERADRMVGAAYRLLAERGRATELKEGDEAFLASCGLDSDETLQLNTIVAYWRLNRAVPPHLAKLAALLSEHAPHVEPVGLAMAEAERLYYRGMAAASLKANGRWRSTLDADLALLDADPLAPATPADQATALRDMHVAATWVAGEVVHRDW